MNIQSALQSFVDFIVELQFTDVFNWKTAIQLMPPKEWKFMWVYVGFTGLNLLGGIFLSLYRKMDEEIRGKLLGFCWTNAIFSAIFFFLRYQRIPLLGTDLVRTIQLIIVLIWAIFIAKYIMFDYPKLKMQQVVEERKSKYLPKAKTN